MLETEQEYKDNLLPIYYNAWENDDNDDALIPLLAELKILLGEDYKDQWKSIGEAAFFLIKKSTYGLTRLITQGLIDPQNIEDDLNKAKDIIEKGVTENWINTEILAYEKTQEQKKKFISSLNQLLKETGKKAVFFVDELDRCRPTFAVETLERIKHLFSIERFYFIIGVDNAQLSHSVKAMYGQEMDAMGYLRRFIDIEANLPEPSIGKFYRQYTEDIDNYLTVSHSCILQNSPDKISLRDCKKLALWVKVLTAKPSHALTDTIIGIFLVIKLKRPRLCQILNYEQFNKEDYLNLKNECIDYISKIGKSTLMIDWLKEFKEYLDFLELCSEGNKEWDIILKDQSAPYNFNFNFLDRSSRDVIRDRLSMVDHIGLYQDSQVS